MNSQFVFKFSVILYELGEIARTQRFEILWLISNALLEKAFFLTVIGLVFVGRSTTLEINPASCFIDSLGPIHFPELLLDKTITELSSCLAI